MVNTLIKKGTLIVAALGTIATTGCQYIPFPFDNTVTTTTTTTVTQNIVSNNTATYVVKNDFSEMISNVRSSVVSINTETSYFSFYGTYTSSGAGSGWIFSEDGIIITNNHVVEGANTVTVTLEDGSTYEAKEIYTDSVTDLAVIKIDATGLTPVNLGDSDSLNVGEWVIAVGNSLGMGISATEGIVSAVDVSFEDEGVYDLIQTSAAINAGNSGGPLFNASGEVVGITSSKMSAVGVEGMAYAISINEAQPIIEQLLENGKVIRPDLGIGMYTNSSSIARRYKLAVDSGVLVTSVSSGSVASEAGLKSGDVIIEIDGITLESATELSTYLQRKSVGDTISIKYYHEDELKTADIVLSQSN